MSVARLSKLKQNTVSSGTPNYNSLLYRGAFTQTLGQVAGRQVRINAGLIKIQNDIQNLFARDLTGPQGPPGEPGYVNVNYSEDIADEFPVFSVQRLASHWTLSDANDRQTDISTSFGFMPLGGLYSDKDSPISYPIHDESAAYFIPMETSKFLSNVPLTTTDIPNFVEVPFHNERIVQAISWECPTSIAARFILLGKPYSGSDTNYFTKYYQIQGEKIFEEHPGTGSLLTTDRRNPSTDNIYTIPLANDTMPPMKSVAVIMYDIRYVPSSARASYNGTHATLLHTRNTTAEDQATLAKGISIRLVCKHRVPTS